MRLCNESLQKHRDAVEGYNFLGVGKYGTIWPSGITHPHQMAQTFRIAKQCVLQKSRTACSCTHLIATTGSSEPSDDARVVIDRAANKRCWCSGGKYFEPRPRNGYLGDTDVTHFWCVFWRQSQRALLHTRSLNGPLAHTSRERGTAAKRKERFLIS